MIKELSKDINEIDKIISENSDTAVFKLCDALKLKISESLKMFQKKMEIIPNQMYLQESDEEWVDENMPNSS